MIEAGVAMRDLTLENPIRAIREVSHDITGRRKVRLANGKEASALEIQQEYFAEGQRVRRAARRRRRPPSGWSTCGAGCWTRSRRGDLDPVDREIDWVTKLRADRALPAPSTTCRCRTRGSPRWTSPTTTCAAAAACTRCWSSAAQVDRVATDLEIFEAKETPPQTTRARLRGEFIRHAQEKRRDFTVDWVHLKLNDQAQRTVLCKDPFRAYDERVERLIASM